MTRFAFVRQTSFFLEKGKMPQWPCLSLPIRSEKSLGYFPPQHFSPRRDHLRARWPHTTGCYSKLTLHSPTLVSSHTYNHQSVVHFLSSVTMKQRGHEEDKRPRYTGSETIFKKVPCYNHFPIKKKTTLSLGSCKHRCFVVRQFLFIVTK